MSQPTGDLLRTLAPQVLGGLLRGGASFADAEDAVQEALLEAATRWPEDGLPREPVAWLRTVARRKLLDSQRYEQARVRREDAVAAEPEQGTPRRPMTRWSCCSAAAIRRCRRPVRLRSRCGPSAG